MTELKELLDKRRKVWNALFRARKEFQEATKKFNGFSGEISNILLADLSKLVKIIDSLIRVACIKEGCHLFSVSGRHVDEYSSSDNAVLIFDLWVEPLFGGSCSKIETEKDIVLLFNKVSKDEMIKKFVYAMNRKYHIFFEIKHGKIKW